MSILCPACHTENSDQSIFCSQCGTELPREVDRYATPADRYATHEPTASHRTPPVTSPNTSPPQSMPASAVYGDFGKRFLAYLIDCLLLSVVILLSVGLVMMVAPAGLPFVDVESELFDFSWGIISMLMSWLYFASFHASAKQATLGKRMMSLKVLDMQGRRLSFGKASVRWLASGVSRIILYIGFIMAAFTDKRQALHDMITDTLVVPSNSPVMDGASVVVMPSQSSNNGCLVAGIIAAVVFVPLIGILAAIALPAYQEYTMRSQIDASLLAVAPLQDFVLDFYQSEGEFPSLEDAMEWQPDDQYVDDVKIDQGSGAISFHPNASQVPSDARMQWVPVEDDDGSIMWVCDGGGVPKKYLPSQCRDNTFD